MVSVIFEPTIPNFLPWVKENWTLVRRWYVKEVGSGSKGLSEVVFLNEA